MAWARSPCVARARSSVGRRTDGTLTVLRYGSTVLRFYGLMIAAAGRFDRSSYHGLTARRLDSTTARQRDSLMGGRHAAAAGVRGCPPLWCPQPPAASFWHRVLSSRAPPSSFVIRGSRLSALKKGGGGGGSAGSSATCLPRRTSHAGIILAPPRSHDRRVDRQRFRLSPAPPCSAEGRACARWERRGAEARRDEARGLTGTSSAVWCSSSPDWTRS